MRFKIVTALAAFLPGAVMPACGSSGGPGNLAYRIPVQTDDGWATGALEEVGMDRAPLLSLLGLVADTDEHMIHGILIVKDGRLVFEQYWRGVDMEGSSLEPVEREFDRDTRHYVASVSKSVTSMLMGVAVDRELFSSPEEPLFSMFPDYSELRTDDNASIVAKHLLAFSSGLDWNEFEYGFDDPRDSHYQMFDTPDPLGFLLGRPVLFPPGSGFLYNSGDTNLVGEAVRRATSSSSLAGFAEEALFRPLGIESYTWWTFPLAEEVTFASGGLSLRPRDMAKLGALYLNAGAWNGEQIVSSAWVQASTEMSTELTGDEGAYGYGYNWWLGRSRMGDGTADFYCAMGWGGQYILVYPELGMVVVFTAGGYWEERPLSFNDLLEDYILPAIASSS